MDLGLTGKLALVTGSTAGIGYATCEAFVREGARVVVNGRSQEGVQAAVARLNAISKESESGVQIPTEMIHYGMTKTAQLAISRGLAEAVAGSGITVNCVLPGPTKSRGVGDFVDALARQEGKTFEQFEKVFFEKVRPTSLIKRFARPEEVASLIVYVASTLASATTGAALRVDGGVVKSAF